MVMLRRHVFRQIRNGSDHFGELIRERRRLRPGVVRRRLQAHGTGPDLLQNVASLSRVIDRLRIADEFTLLVADKEVTVAIGIDVYSEIDPAALGIF